MAMSETTLHAVDRWSGGACPFEAGWRKVMMWSFIVTDGLLFAGFLASYGYARAMSGVLARSGGGLQPAVHHADDLRVDHQQRDDGQRGLGGAARPAAMPSSCSG